MKTLQLRDAKASFSAVVEAAERGEATTITKHGRPAAVVMPVEEAEKLLASRKPSFVDMLLSIPAPLEFERDQTPVRPAEF